MSNLTIGAPSTGGKIIQAADFYETANVLHPIIVGTIAIALLFAYLRLASNRSIAPITLFDSIVSVALGSTLAGVVVRFLKINIVAFIPVLALRAETYTSTLEWHRPRSWHARPYSSDVLAIRHQLGQRTLTELFRQTAYLPAPYCCVSWRNSLGRDDGAPHQYTRSVQRAEGEAGVEYLRG